MIDERKHKFMFGTVISVILFVVLLGCSLPTKAKSNHFGAFLVQLPNVKVVIVSKPPHGKPGWAVKNNTIYVVGEKQADGRITVDQRVLGHELQHLLNWTQPDSIRHPHDNR